MCNRKSNIENGFRGLKSSGISGGGFGGSNPPEIPKISVEYSIA